MNIKELLKKKRLYLDGAMGSLLQDKLDEIGPVPEALNLMRPELIKEIHQQYINAGANIILANTFGVNGYKLKNTTYSVDQLVTAGVKKCKIPQTGLCGAGCGTTGNLNWCFGGG